MIVETGLRPKTRIQNPEIFLSDLVFVQGSCDESGDEIEDPNDSLTMRTPFTGLRPEQILESLVSPPEFCSKILRRYHRLSSDFGQNPKAKIQGETVGRITGGSGILPRGCAGKSSWTKIL